MSQATRESEGLTLLGNQRTQYAQDYDPSLLETFENKHPEHDYMVTFLMSHHGPTRFCHALH